MWKITNSRRKPLAWITACAVLFVTSALPAYGQDQAQSATPPAPGPTATPALISAADIPVRAGRTGTLIREISNRVESDMTVDNIEEQIVEESERIGALKDRTTDEIERFAARSVLDDTDKEWQRTENRLEEWLQALGQRGSEVEIDRALLGREQTVWEETRSEATDADLPAVVVEQVREVLRAIVATERQLSSQRERLLTLQVSVSEQKTRAIQARTALGEAIAGRAVSIFQQDSPTLWMAFRQTIIADEFTVRMSETFRANLAAARTYIDDEPDRLKMHAALFVVVLGMILLYRRRVLVWVRQDPSLEKTASLLQRPIAASLLLSVLFDDWIHPQAPQAWVQFTGLVLVLAVLRLLPQMVPARLHSGLYMLVVLYVLHWLVEMIPNGTMLNRLVLLLLCMVACGSFAWFSKQLPRSKDPAGGWKRLVAAGFRLAATIFGVAIAANLIGNVALATLLETGTLASFYWAILLWAGAVLLNGMVTVELKASGAHALLMVRYHSDVIRRTAWRFVTVFAVGIWSIMTLSWFRILEKVLAMLGAVIEAEFDIIGNVTVAPINFLVFPLVVWLSFQVSRLLRFVLESDVLPRVELPRGVPNAISKGTHYLVVLSGLVIAGLAAEIPFDRLTLIVGALGVGVGFGMQNVVNNFISGLILLFERPIQVGDLIQLENLSGTVHEIGIRASRIRTLQGAEVIVPNANLISSEVTNWTLSDQLRRIDVPVGVAYGIDPEKVIELLTGVARDHEDVLDDPPPCALVRRFGDSALEFELRCWTVDDFLRVGSELTVGIARALAAAGISIPYPQRDVHLRTELVEATAVQLPAQPPPETCDLPDDDGAEEKC